MCEIWAEKEKERKTFAAEQQQIVKSILCRDLNNNSSFRCEVCDDIL